MSYSITIPLALGSSQTGLTLKAQIVDTTGVNVGSVITTGFVEIGLGNYIWTGNIPNGQQGGIIFADNGSGVIKAATSLNLSDEVIVDHIDGTVNDAGPTTSSFIGSSNLSGTNNFYLNMLLVFGGTSALAGIPSQITGYNGTTKVINASFPVAPANGDKFMIIGRVA